jgi:hypothetical protein
VLVMISTACYEQRWPDGSKEVYNLADVSGRVFLRQVVDPRGNAVTLYYDADLSPNAAQPFRLNSSE